MKRVGIAAGVLAVIVAGLGTWFLVWRGQMVAEWEREQAAVPQLKSVGGWVGDPISVGSPLAVRRLGNKTYFQRWTTLRIDNRMKGCSYNAKDLEGVQSLRQLRKITVTGNEASISPDALRQFRGLTEVRVLYLLAKSSSDPILEMHCSAMSHLEVLFLDGEGLSAEGFAGLARAKSLRTLSIRRASLSNDAWQRLGEFQGLVELYLIGCKGVDDKVAVALGGIRGLRKLNLRATGCGNEGIKSIVSLPELQELDLTQTSITDDCVEYLCKAPSLRELTVSRVFFGKGISDAGVRRLKDSANPRLVVKAR